MITLCSKVLNIFIIFIFQLLEWSPLPLTEDPQWRPLTPATSTQWAQTSLGSMTRPPCYPEPHWLQVCIYINWTLHINLVLLPVIKLVFFAPFFRMNLEVKFLHNYCLKVNSLEWRYLLGSFPLVLAQINVPKIAVCFGFEENKLVMLRISIDFWETCKFFSKINSYSWTKNMYYENYISF